MRCKNTTIIKPILRQIIFYLFLIVAWQGCYYLCVTVLKLWKPYAFPNPLGVWNSFMLLIKKKALFSAVFFSLKRAFFGFFISSVIGLILGLVITKIKILTDTLKPLILGVQSLPSICWVPFAILWFGLSEKAIIFVIVMGSVFSIAISVDAAIKNVNPIYIKAAKSMGARSLDLYFKVIFPASLPYLLSGFKQGWSFAWRSLMAGEVMTASVGLGQALAMGRDLADINRVMLIIIIIILLGILIEKLVFTFPENKILKRMGII